MTLFPEYIQTAVEPIREEVKQFVMSRDSYHAITEKGRIFNIIQSYNLSTTEDDREDFHSYLLVRSLEGYFLLRQRFLNRMPLSWYLEAELVPADDGSSYWGRLYDYLSEHGEILGQICGEPHECPEKCKKHTESIYIKNIEGAESERKKQ